MNLSRSKTLIGLLYAVILSLPLLNIAGRVLYTQWNKNAKDSFTGEVQYLQTLSLQKFYQMNSISSHNYTLNDITTYYYEDNIFYSSIYTYEYDLFGSNRYTAYGFNAKKIVFTFHNGVIREFSNCFVSFSRNRNDGNHLLQVYENNLFSQSDCTLSKSYDAFAVFKKANLYQSPSYQNTSGVSFSYTGLDKYFYFTSTNDIATINSNLFTNLSISVGTLDNAFEYSIQKITNNNIGEVQFFTWFADLFLDLDNASNMLYVGFVNWYFNYVLLVSLGYLMFMVLMWFIGLARKILEKGQNFGEGGY